MVTYVALLRGIGPSNPNMRPAKLKEAFEKMKLRNVRTVIASGNVVFESASTNEALLEKKIEQALPQYLGFTSMTIIRSRADLEAMVKKNPFQNKEHSNRSYLLVSFLKDKTLVPGGALYTAFNLEEAQTPDVMRKLEKKYQKAITSRTWKTVERILKKMGTR